MSASDMLVGAIALGAPTFNAGDHAGCYRLYERAARALEASFTTHCTGVATALRDGRLRALATTSDTDRAWLMRYTFDAVLYALETY